MMPVPLSYYSPLVGGLPGATALGMEPTYYWDALTDDALDWLNAHTAPGESILFPVITGTSATQAQTGKLRPPSSTSPRRARRRRPGVVRRPEPPRRLPPQDRALVARARPEDVLVAKWGVPLVWAFPRLSGPGPPGR